MGKMGLGYGSEFHLLRWMGRHRDLFTNKVSQSIGNENSIIEWVDFDFASVQEIPDSELKGLEFLYDENTKIETKWKGFWPTRSGIHNWDAVGWRIIEDSIKELILIEAKAHIKELESDCGAKDKDSILKIKEAFELVTNELGIKTTNDWFKKYYQMANRIAALYFLNEKVNIPTKLVNIYFIGDKSIKSSRKCPKTVNEWESKIFEQDEYLGIKENAWLSKYMFSLFLHVANEPFT